MVEFSYGKGAGFTEEIEEEKIKEEIKNAKELILAKLKLVLEYMPCKIDDTREGIYVVKQTGTDKKHFEIHETKSNGFGMQYKLFINSTNVSEIFSNFELKQLIGKVKSKANGNTANANKSYDKLNSELKKVCLYLQDSIQND